MNKTIISINCIIAVLWGGFSIFSQTPGIKELPPLPSRFVTVPTRNNSENPIPPQYYYYSITTNCNFEFLGRFSTELWQKWFNETEQNHSKFQAIIASKNRLDLDIEVTYGKECR